jgi:hypothetical protein
MYKLLLVSALFLSVVISPLKAEQCERFAVTATDGYVNVRSVPRVQKNNIVGTLPTGFSLSLITQRQGWWQINSPFQGWVAGNQIGKISCDQAHDLLYKLGYPTMNHLGKKAIQGDRMAAETLIKMSGAMDGANAEIYAESISHFAGKNPNFLISILNQESSFNLPSILQFIDFGLGSGNTQKRQNFEEAINRLPTNSMIRQYWQN